MLNIVLGAVIVLKVFPVMLTHPLPGFRFEENCIFVTNEGGFLLRRLGKELLEGSVRVAWDKWKTFADLHRTNYSESMSVDHWAVPYSVWPGCKTDFLFEDNRIIKPRWRLLYPGNYSIAEMKATFEERHGRILKFSYDLVIEREKVVDELSASFCFPVRKFAGRLHYALPGFTVLNYPENKGRHPLDQRMARGVIIALGSEFQTSIWAESPKQWILTDQRHFNLNTYRLYFNQIPQSSRIRKAQKVNISYELVLGGFLRRISLDAERYVCIALHGFGILFEDWNPLLIISLSLQDGTRLGRLEDSSAISSIEEENSLVVKGVFGGGREYTAVWKEDKGKVKVLYKITDRQGVTPLLSLISPVVKSPRSWQLVVKTDSPSAQFETSLTVCPMVIQIGGRLTAELSTISYYQSRCLQVLLRPHAGSRTTSVVLSAENSQ